MFAQFLLRRSTSRKPEVFHMPCCFGCKCLDNSCANDCTFNVLSDSSSKLAPFSFRFGTKHYPISRHNSSSEPSKSIRMDWSVDAFGLLWGSRVGVKVAPKSPKTAPRAAQSIPRIAARYLAMGSLLSWVTEARW